jgi:serine acetyltransferase
MVIHTPYGVFIPPVKIGANCTFTTGTLLNSGCKSVGDNVYFGAGCKIIGDVKIGNNVVVVANSVVLTDVPDNTTIMGVPARIKLPGGRPKKFPWRAIDRKDVKPEGANGQAASPGPNGNRSSASGSNGSSGVAAPAEENKPASRQ